MNYVIGIDSGGTHYRVRACDLQGDILGEYVGLPTHRHLLGDPTMLRRINANIDACLEIFHGNRADCAYMVCGTTGIDSAEDAQFFTSCYESLPDFRCPIICMNDAEIAHYAVTGGEGLLVISGTGSIAFGVNADGQSARVGGWMPSIMGDEGSGTWVSRQALRHLGRYFDHSVPYSRMTELISQSLEIYTPKQLIDFSVRLALNPNYPCLLAPLVDQAANEGDEWAAALLRHAASETFSLVQELVQVLGLSAQDTFKVGLWGSNILQSRTHREAFLHLLRQHYSHAIVCESEVTALEGATKLALEYLNGRGIAHNRVFFSH